MRLIDANDVKAALLGWDTDPTDEEIEFTIDRIPTVNAVEVVHGRWISYLDGDSIMPDRYYRCSECCDRGWRRKWPYCPNCGAKMDGDIK